MTIWWKTDNCDIDITPVEVIKETPSRLVYLRINWEGKKYQDKVNKVSEYHRFYPTFEEARTALIERSKRDRESAAAEEKECANNIAKLLDLKEPVTGGTQ